MALSDKKIKYGAVIGVCIIMAIAIGLRIWMLIENGELISKHVLYIHLSAGFTVAICAMVLIAAKNDYEYFAAVSGFAALIWAAVFLTLLCIYWNGKEISTDATAKVNRAWDNGEMDSLQRDNECCGKISAQDYVLINRPMPNSCFPKTNNNTRSILFMDGCIVKLNSRYSADLSKLTAYFWTMFSCALLTFPFATLLAINLYNRKRRMDY